MNKAIKGYLLEYNRYRAIIEKAVEQVSNEKFNVIPYTDANSVAMVVRHLAGNLKSRFTDFLTSDGEKSWRDRENEFAEGPFTRKEVMEAWNTAWEVIDKEVGSLADNHLEQEVAIRGVALTVREALNRSVAHLAYHAGQIVLLARLYADGDWQWITIPKGGSAAYNQNPTMEKSFQVKK